jgi:hypothetical protein
MHQKDFVYFVLAIDLPAKELTQGKPDDHISWFRRLGHDKAALVDGLVVEGQSGEAGQRRPLFDEHFASGVADEVVGQAL